MQPDIRHTAVRLRASLSALHRQLRHALPAERIGVARLSVLGHLYRRGPMTPSALAALERVKLQTLTRLLAELEADGWIAREADPADGRRTLLSLTRRGVQHLTADVHRREASLAAAIERTLTANQQAALLRACDSLDALAQALSSSSSESAEEETTR